MWYSALVRAKTLGSIALIPSRALCVVKGVITLTNTDIRRFEMAYGDYIISPKKKHLLASNY